VSELPLITGKTLKPPNRPSAGESAAKFSPVGQHGFLAFPPLSGSTFPPANMNSEYTLCVSPLPFLSS
jgi:hypothetical protein